MLQQFFNDTKNGFFVEAGALDGEFLSNTLRLEKEQGWSGLLVEPNPSSFRQLLRKRRKAWIVNACLSSDIYPKQVTMVSVSSRKRLLDMSPLVTKGSSYQLESPPLLNYSDVNSFFDKTDRTYFQSQCFPLYSLLLALNITVIDFMSLDMQGFELEVVNTLPLDKIFVRSFALEGKMLFKIDVFLVRQLNKKGFYLVNYHMGGPDYFFINIRDKDLMKIGKNYYKYFQSKIDNSLPKDHT